MGQTWKIGVVMVAFTMGTTVQAEDVYNFYFQKSPDAKKVIQSKNGQETISIEDKEFAEFAEEGETRKERRERRRAERRALRAQKLEKRLKEKKERRKNFRKWAVGVGTGAIVRPDVSFYPGAPIEQHSSGYNLVGNYRLNKYFDIEGAILIPAEASGFGKEPSNYFEGSIGLGITPLHLSIFGGQFLSFGVVAGYMRGYRFSHVGGFYDYNGSEGMEVSGFFGPRIGMEFSKSIELVASYKRDRKFKEFAHSSLTLNYKW